MEVSDAPIRLSERLSPAEFRGYRQRAIFEAAKWDIQINDHCALGDRALVVDAPEWAMLSNAASRLAAELLGAERRLLEAVREGRLPHLDRKTRKQLARLAPAAGIADLPRLIRFDFHFCAGRWFISEANCDVPGGINEASQLVRLWPRPEKDTAATGDPASAYVDGIERISGGKPVAFVHATAFSDDWQLMKYLADALAARGVEPIAAAPDRIAWRNGEARAGGRELGAIVRFFPGDWLVRTSFARHWFADTATPVLNPLLSLLAQNKAFPLFLRALGIDAPAWRQFLPMVRPVSLGALRSEDVVVKPVYGRVGEGVAIGGVTPRKKLRRYRLTAAIFRRHWIAQDRFRVSNIGSAAEPAYPTVGIYTLGERVIGAYGRVSSQPLIDMDARDVPVFIAGERHGGGDGAGRTLQ